MPGEYDQTLLENAPEVSTSQRQEGYTLDLLQENQGRKTPKAPQPSRTPVPAAVGSGSGRGTPASNEGYAANKEVDQELAGFKSSPRRVPFYRTTKGMIIIALTALAVVAIAVGAGVGVSSKKNKDNRNVVVTATGTSTATASVGDGGGGGADGATVSSPHEHATPVPQESQTPPTPTPTGGVSGIAGESDNAGTNAVNKVAGALKAPQAADGDTLA